MADRKGQRSRQAQAGAQARPSAAARGQPQTIATLRAECARLKAELEAAQAEVADLKTRHDDVLNRIVWVLDSLNSLAEAEP